VCRSSLFHGRAAFSMEIIDLHVPCLHNESIKRDSFSLRHNFPSSCTNTALSLHCSTFSSLSHSLSFARSLSCSVVGLISLHTLALSERRRERKTFPLSLSSFTLSLSARLFFMNILSLLACDIFLAPLERFGRKIQKFLAFFRARTLIKSVTSKSDSAEVKKVKNLICLPTKFDVVSYEQQ
jgi:hypothetical protein